MPKVKSNRSAAKRFTKTGSGKFKRKKAGANHWTGKKDSSTIRGLRKSALVSDVDTPKIKKILPY